MQPSLDSAVRQYRRVTRRVGLGVATLVGASFIVISLPFALFFPDGVLGPYGGFVILLGLALGFAIWLDWMGRVRLLQKALPVLEGLAGLAEAGVAGRDFFCTIRHQDPSVAPLTVRPPAYVDDLGLNLEVPWNVPADVFAVGRYAYSDLPAAMAEVKAAQKGLPAGEYLWTDVEKGRLESFVRPGWNRWPKRDESPESIRDRILDRWRHMEGIRRAAAIDPRFMPELLTENGDGRGLGPFAVYLWCRQCRKVRWMATKEVPERCRRCRSPLIRFFARTPTWFVGNIGRSKIERIERHYKLEGPVL